MNGYDATMLCAEERPDLLPLLRVVLALGDEGFNEALDELVRRGLLIMGEPLSAGGVGDDDSA